MTMQSAGALIIKVKNDTFQGILGNKSCFYVQRMCSPNNHIFNKFLFGNAHDEALAPTLAKFILETGGIDSRYILFTEIAPIGSSRALIVTNHDQIVDITTRAFALIGKVKTNSYLRQSYGVFESCIEVERQ